MIALFIILMIGVLLMVLTTELDTMGLIFSYDRIGKVVTSGDVAGHKIQTIQMAVANAAGANAWTQVGVINGLNPNKEYALMGAYSYSTTAKAIRFQHASFGGLHPGGLMGTTISQRKNQLDFKDFGELPVFSSNSDLKVEIFCSSADASPVVFVEVVEL